MDGGISAAFGGSSDSISRNLEKLERELDASTSSSFEGFRSPPFSSTPISRMRSASERMVRDVQKEIERFRAWKGDISPFGAESPLGTPISSSREDLYASATSALEKVQTLEEMTTHREDIIRSKDAQIKDLQADLSFSLRKKEDAKTQSAAKKKKDDDASMLGVMRSELQRAREETESWRRKCAEAEVQVQRLKGQIRDMKDRLLGTISRPMKASRSPSAGASDVRPTEGVADRIRRAMMEVSKERDWLLREVKSIVDGFDEYPSSPGQQTSEIARLRRAMRIAVQENETLKLQLETLRSVPLLSNSSVEEAPIIDHKTIIAKGVERAKREISAVSVVLPSGSNAELKPKSIADGVVLRLKAAREKIEVAEKTAVKFSVEAETLRAQLRVVKHHALKNKQDASDFKSALESKHVQEEKLRSAAASERMRLSDEHSEAAGRFTRKVAQLEEDLKKTEDRVRSEHERAETFRSKNLDLKRLIKAADAAAKESKKSASRMREHNEKIKVSNKDLDAQTKRLEADLADAHKNIEMLALEKSAIERRARDAENSLKISREEHATALRNAHEGASSRVVESIEANKAHVKEIEQIAHKAASTAKLASSKLRKREHKLMEYRKRVEELNDGCDHWKSKAASIARKYSRLKQRIRRLQGPLEKDARQKLRLEAKMEALKEENAILGGSMSELQQELDEQAREAEEMLLRERNALRAKDAEVSYVWKKLEQALAI